MRKRVEDHSVAVVQSLPDMKKKLRCPECCEKRNDHRVWCSRPPLMMLPDCKHESNLDRALRELSEMSARLINTVALLKEERERSRK